jgi:ABC-2 type transport system permease protein
VSGRLQELRAFTRRWYLQLVRERLNLILIFVQPAFWLVFFGGAVRMVINDQIIGTPDYVAFMLPGVIAFTVLGTAINGAVPLLWDKETGYLNKLMSMPVARGSLLVSRLGFQAAVAVAQVAVVLLVANVMGVRVATGVAGWLVLLGIAALLAVALTAIFLMLAFQGPGHTTFFSITGFISLPLVFMSNAFAPLDAMPYWMAQVARFNPLTHAIEVARAIITSGWRTGLVRSAAGLIAFTAISTAATYFRFRIYTKTAR